MCHRDSQTTVAPPYKFSLNSLVVALLAAVIITGCNNESGLIDTSDPPHITLTSPSADEKNVVLDAIISATFNRQMDPSSINDTTFTVFRDTTAIVGAISYSDSTATFTPTNNLTAGSTIRARITTNVRDMEGNTMDRDFEWSFTTEDKTEPESDITPPQVVETNPARDAQNIQMNSAVTATFSEVMNPSTINTATFLLEMGTTVISGSVSYSGMTAVFTPSGNLQPDTNYSATITNGVQDTAGNALPEDYTWSFNTEDAGEGEADTIPPTVNATNPENEADNVPVTTTVSATFSEAMNASTITATTFTLSGDGDQVPGTVEYSDTEATFNPDANLENSTTYTATITSGAQDTAGNSLAENHVWTFTTEEEEEESDTVAPEVRSTNPGNNDDDVSVNATLSVTFSEEMNASTISEDTFTLTDGKNSVNGTVKYSDNTATFDPDEDLDYDTRYTAKITTGAEDQAGNSLADDYEWDFRTEEDDSDNEPPVVNSTDPDDNDNNISVSTSVRATFSETMDASTISTSTFTLSEGGNTVSGSVSYSGKTATFNPNEDLEHDARYTATITTGAEDEAGNPLSEDYEWDFRTEEEPDNEAPSVSSTDPDDGENNVAVGSSIRATFSETMDASTISTSTFTLSGGGGSVSGSVSYSGKTATFNPNEDLDYDTRYTARITTGAEDQAGNPLASDYQWSFTTEEADEPEDTTPPQITETFPEDDENNVDTNISITATFSEPLEPSSVNNNTFVLRRQVLLFQVKVSGTVSYSGTTATFTPDENLLDDEDYTVTLTTGITDLSGNALSNNYEWSFETAKNDDDNDDDDDDDDD